MIQTTEVSITYKGDGVQTSFPYPYPYRNSDDIVGYIINDVGYEKRITNNFKYDKVSNIYQYPLAGDPLAAPYSIKLIRETPQQQNADLPGKLPFSLIEKSLDWIIMILQEIGSRCNSLWHIRNDCKLSETNARNSASAAAESENLAKKWAMSPVSPDGVADTNSPTGYTQSAKIWAALSKEYAGLSKFKLPIGYYNSVDEMRKSETAIVGRPCVTLGYYEPNDGGGGVYVIRQKKESDIDDGGSVLFLDNGNVAELIVDGSVNVKQFGAKGDGTTDDTSAVQQALTLCRNVVFTTGTYMIDAEKKLTVSDNTHITINHDATVQAIANSVDRYYIFYVSAKNVIIDGGGKILGERDNHNGTTGQWGYGVAFLDAEDCILRDIEIAKCWGDSVLVSSMTEKTGGLSKNIKIYNCYLHDSRRQGISIISAKNCIVDGCKITGINGTAPQSAIDIESDFNGAETNNNIIIRNCYMSDCAGNIMQVVNHADKVYIEHCTFDTKHSLYIYKTTGTVNFIDCNPYSLCMNTGGTVNLTDCTLTTIKIQADTNLNAKNTECTNLIVQGASNATMINCKIDSANGQFLVAPEGTFSDNPEDPTTTAVEVVLDSCYITGFPYGICKNFTIKNCQWTNDILKRLHVKDRFILMDSVLNGSRYWRVWGMGMGSECILKNNVFLFDDITTTDGNEGLIEVWSDICVITGNYVRNKAGVSIAFKCGYTGNTLPCSLAYVTNNIAKDNSKIYLVRGVPSNITTYVQMNIDKTTTPTISSTTATSSD